MRALILAAMMAFSAPMAAYAGHSVSVTAGSDGSASVTYTYTW